MATRKKPTRKPKLKPKPGARRASDVVDEARLALTAGWPTTDLNTHATLVLFALARALRREDPTALGRLASAARNVLTHMGDPDGQAQPRPDWTNAGHLGVGVDELTHRKFVLQTMSEMLAHHKEALDRTDPRKPPPLPAPHMAKALSRLLGSGPLRSLFASTWTPEKDGDAERIIAAWTDRIAGDGCIHVDEDPAALAQKLIVDALVALGASRKPTLDAFAPKALGKEKASDRARR
jgi:hypothetical protein